jgi:hypothetical protein
LLVSAIKKEIIREIKHANYFSVILDYTPDVSHQEQISLMIGYVDVSSNYVSIEEPFLGFLNLMIQLAKSFFNVLQNELRNLDLGLFNVRGGQSCDNGLNTKGKHLSVQKKFLDINSSVFYILCGCCSVNLALCDMTNSCIKAKHYFRVVQHIYTIFINSIRRLQILNDYVKWLTPKSLSPAHMKSPCR